MNCDFINSDRRKKFWTTQPEGCGSYENCGGACGSPGLIPVDSESGRTIANNDWVRGLALNILLTNGRQPSTPCGYRPGTRGGHWSDSFRGDSQTSGSLLRTVPAKGSIRDQMKLIRSFAEADLSKLILYKVATRVEVEASYRGSNIIDLIVRIYGQNSEVTKVGITGSRLQNSWVWDT